MSGPVLTAEALEEALSPEEREWLTVARRMAAAGERAMLPLVGSREGRSPVGRGEGGDTTVGLDARAEEAMLQVLDESAPAPCNLVSEELGIRVCEGADCWVLVDPVDGSLNAKRGLNPFSGVVAVSWGPVLGDVALGCTRVYGSGEEYLAGLGRGVAPPDSRGQGALHPEGKVELVLVEGGAPSRHDFLYRDLAMSANAGVSRSARIRQVGSLAVALCLVATGVADVLVAPVGSRSVDIAAGVLTVKEAGGGVAGLDGQVLAQQPLDLRRRSPLVAWRSGLDGEALQEEASGLLQLGV